jgi:cbb3-type cytochrome oxidase maturation protein
MSIIFVLIPLGLTLLVAAVLAFFWAVRTGQFDDLESPAWRILMDNEREPPPAPPQPSTDSRPDGPA